MTETFISYTVKNENGKPLKIQEKSAILCKSRIADLEQVRGVENGRCEAKALAVQWLAVLHWHFHCHFSFGRSCGGPLPSPQYHVGICAYRCAAWSAYPTSRLTAWRSLRGSPNDSRATRSYAAGRASRPPEGRSLWNRRGALRLELPAHIWALH